MKNTAVGWNFEYLQRI